MKKSLVSFAIVLASLAGIAHAAPVELVTNGGFETSGGNGQIGYNTTITGWSTPITNGNYSYNFLYAAGTADTTGATGQYGGPIKLWGPGDGSANGLPASSPNGGKFIAADSDFQVGPIQQTINGLVVGKKYNLSFYWAAAQQAGFSGPTYDQWDVTLGSETHSTAQKAVASQGFSPWVLATMTFTATATTELLSFLANGGPSGTVPPFALLDGVSLTLNVPEPGTMWQMMLGLGLVGMMVLRKRKAAAL